jgi:hypothetical protein
LADLYEVSLEKVIQVTNENASRLKLSADY